MFGFFKKKESTDSIDAVKYHALLQLITGPREDFISKALELATSSYYSFRGFPYLDKKEVLEIGIKKMEEILEEYDRLHLWSVANEETVQRLSDDVYWAIEKKDREKANA